LHLFRYTSTTPAARIGVMVGGGVGNLVEVSIDGIGTLSNPVV
jgi:hypothetical protein